LPHEERIVTILHEGRKLSGGLVVRGDEPGPLTARLQPWGVVTGRLVDTRGEPRTGVEVGGMDRPKLDPTTGGIRPAVAVGEDGRFRIEGLVPGRKYTFRALKGNYGLGVMAEGVTVESGESRDLGDVRTKDEG